MLLFLHQTFLIFLIESLPVGQSRVDCMQFTIFISFFSSKDFNLAHFVGDEVTLLEGVDVLSIPLGVEVFIIEDMWSLLLGVDV